MDRAIIKFDLYLRTDERYDCWPTVDPLLLNARYPPLPSDILEGLMEAELIQDDEEQIILGVREHYVVKLAVRDEAACLRNEALVMSALTSLGDSTFVGALYYSHGLNSSYFPDDKVDALVMPRIYGTLLTDYLKSCSAAEGVRTLKEIIKSVYGAWKAIGFTHYDLHSRNVIVTSEGPRIIDYGYSFVKTESQSGLVLAMGAVMKESNWIHDIVKLLAAYWRERTDTKHLLEIDAYINTLPIEELVNLLDDHGDIDGSLRLRKHYAEALESGDGEKETILIDDARKRLSPLLIQHSWIRVQNDPLCLALMPLLRYFSIRTDSNRLERRPHELIERLDIITRYFTVFNREVENASFERLMTIVDEIA